MPGKETDETILGAIVPHAGYSFSGPCAAWIYKAIAESKKPDFFIILGANHHTQENVLTQETFDTPFGYVRVEQEFCRKLLEKGHIKADDEAHQKEHSIEVQIPFLQFIYGDHPEKVKIIPILVGSETNIKELGVDIKEVLMESGKTAIIIASSDFTHYGRNYHYIPFSSDIPQQIYDFDKEAIEFIKEQNPEGLLDFCDKNSATICGANAIALLLYSIAQSKVLLEQYYISGDLNNDYKNTVSYAGILLSLIHI